MLKLNSKEYGMILVNDTNIAMAMIGMDGATLIRLSDGKTISVTDTLDSIEVMLLSKVTSPTISVNKESNTVAKPTIAKPTIAKPTIAKPTINTKSSTKKIYDDEFPDDFPRYPNGKIRIVSNAYKQFMAAKESN